MKENDPEILSEEEAARLWARAAQLQAEAAGRVSAPEGEGDVAPASGYALTHVRAAALEAGISTEFVEAALTDLRVERTVPTARGHALARRVLRDPPDTITVRRLMEATPQEVLSAMQAVFPDAPFRLTLMDQQGDPLHGGVLVFDIPSNNNNNPFDTGFAFAAKEAGLRQVFVSLRSIERSVPSCELTVHSPVTSHNIGFGLTMVAATLSGGAGLASLGALGVVIGLGPVGAIVGAFLGAGAGAKGFQAVYAFAMRRARRSLEGLVSAVAARASGVW